MLASQDLIVRSSGYQTVHPSEYRFDEFRVDVLQRTLLREGDIVPIPSKAFSLLLLFVRHQGLEVTKEDLMQALWPNTHVEPCNLTQAIFLLRRALGEGGKGQRYIVTIPGRGYMFAGRVRSIPNAGAVGDVLSNNSRLQRRERLTQCFTRPPEAYKAYLKGRYHANRWTVEGLTKAIDCFTEAVAFDPNFALAYSGIADSYYIISNIYSPPNEVMPKARAAAEKALELDPALAEAHTSQALIEGFYAWNWQKSEAGFRRAIMLDPGYPSAHLWYGRLLTTCGRFDEACAELNKAQTWDPLSCSVNAEVGRTLFYAQKYKEAKEQLREALELNPLFWPAQLFHGWVYEQQGQFTEALAILKQCNALDDNPRTRAFLGVTHALAGEEAPAEKILAYLIDQRMQRHIPAYYIAIIYAALNNRDRAFSWLEKAYDDRSEWLVWLQVDPRFDKLRDDWRFESLLAKSLFTIS